jgi:hypothetical protein
MSECVQCKRAFSGDDCLASISGSIIGDEVTDSYFFCPGCGAHTKVSWWDSFTGVETMNVSGPLPKQDVRERVDLIRKCSSPWDKKCRCAAHREYFNDTLD